MLIFVVCALKLECLLFVLEGRYEKRRGRGGGVREGRGREGGEREGRREKGREGLWERDGRTGARDEGRDKSERGGISCLNLHLVPWKQLTAEL